MQPTRRPSSAAPDGWTAAFHRDAHRLNPGDFCPRPTDRRSPLLPRQLGQAPGDLGVTVSGGVLVAHRGAGGALTQPAHELSQRRIGLGSEDYAGVSVRALRKETETDSPTSPPIGRDSR